MASFDTGATRNDDTEKHDPDGFLSPFALESYFEYMTKHRLQHDGKLRASDNWKLGIPMERYMKSLWRHFFDVWKISDGMTAIDPDSGEKVNLETALNGVLFNTLGMLHTTAKQRQSIQGSYPEHFTKPDSIENWEVTSIPEVRPGAMVEVTEEELKSRKTLGEILKDRAVKLNFPGFCAK